MSPPLVLLVDDFEDAREMYAEYLRFRGFRVATAESGEASLALAQADRPDIILLDLQMQGLSGRATLREMRKLPALTGVPIVAFTAHALEHEQAAALVDGFDAVIPKPCMPDDLVTLIAPFLER